MSKTLLTEALAANTGLSKAAAGKAVEALFGILKKGLKETGRFSLPGIGAFAVKQAAARESRNPRTGAKMTTPARKKVKFTESSDLRSAAATYSVAA